MQNEPILTIPELQALTEALSMQWFHKPFQHVVSYNSRLRTTGGRYMLSDHSIEVNPQIEKEFGRDEVVGVIKHELCHYHLHIEGRGYKHGDSDFKALLKKTNSPRFCKSLKSRKLSSRSIRIYSCMQCGLRYERKRRVDTQRYRCGKCHGVLKETK
ncbi:SprT family protein [Sporosarcina sp. A2]|uniref:SprT family protein n=1 Tax=Sporosarcina sp. A2 TaxID=3393449 RepID=UPI003D7A7CA5